MYITFYKQNQNTKLDYNSIVNQQTAIPEMYIKKVTYNIKCPTRFENLNNKQKEAITELETQLNKIFVILEPFKDNYSEQYYEFYIPKHSRGLRKISAPNPEFKEALTKTKEILENDLKCLAHSAAYAYVKNRSAIDAVKVHQENNSNWYMKLDIKDFFPSCTPEIIYNQLIKLYPFYYFSNRNKILLKKIIEICCLHNGLPQGTPTSPLLTNLIMIPFDYAITKLLNSKDQDFRYTRYADDILISSKVSFNWRELQDEIQEILNPFILKKEKTRYGSKAGSNWNLGLMLNKDNNITLGYTKKKILNAMLNNFLKDFSNNNYWDKNDTRVLQGQLSYLAQVEPEYLAYIMHKYTQKYNISYNYALKTVLNS